MNRPPRPAYYSAYFDEACTLSEIASDMSRKLFVDDEALDENKEQLAQTVDSLYRRLKEWHDGLPSEFDPSHKPAAHVLLLQYANSQHSYKSRLTLLVYGIIPP